MRSLFFVFTSNSNFWKRIFTNLPLQRITISYITKYGQIKVLYKLYFLFVPFKQYLKVMSMFFVKQLCASLYDKLFICSALIFVCYSDNIKVNIRRKYYWIVIFDVVYSQVYCIYLSNKQ